MSIDSEKHSTANTNRSTDKGEGRPPAATGSGIAGASSSSLPPVAPGVLGGSEEWSIVRGDCSGALHWLIELCLNRDPEARPAFEELVGLFRDMLERPPEEIFLQLEVPRLREALAYGDDLNAAVAASEILHVASYSLFCNMPSFATVRGRHVVRASGFEALGAAAGAGESDKGPAGLAVRYKSAAGLFSPVLPFAPSPSRSVSQMNSIAYVGLPTVLQAGPELLSGLVARMRTVDVDVRSRLGIPLFCPDLPSAVRGGPDASSLVAFREHDYGRTGRTGACLADYAKQQGLGVVASVFAKQHGSSSSPPSTSREPGPPGEAAGSGAGHVASSAPGSSAPVPAGRKMTAKDRAAARAAAQKEEEEKKRRRAAVTAACECLHAASVLIQVLEAGSPAVTSTLADDGSEPQIGAGHSAKLPPTGSIERVLLTQASRTIYSLAGIIACSSLSTAEHEFVTRPMGGAAVNWRLRYKTVTNFPASLPEFGPDAVAAAASMLRLLWDRLPLLRSAIAHVLAATCLSMSNLFGQVQVLVHRPGAAPGEDEWLPVLVPEDTIQARICGVFVGRLYRELGDEGVAMPSSPLRKHNLVLAVEGRMVAATVKRIDGVVLGSIEIDEFDPTLC